MLSGIYEFYETRCREARASAPTHVPWNIRHSDSKERLSNVCVLPGGMQSLQYCLYERIIRTDVIKLIFCPLCYWLVRFNLKDCHCALHYAQRSVRTAIFTCPAEMADYLTTPNLKLNKTLWKVFISKPQFRMAVHLNAHTCLTLVLSRRHCHSPAALAGCSPQCKTGSCEIPMPHLQQARGVLWSTRAKYSRKMCLKFRWIFADAQLQRRTAIYKYSGVRYNERMVQRTVFINKIRMLQRTQSYLDSFFQKADKRPPTNEPPTVQSVRTMIPLLPPSRDFFTIFIRECLFTVFCGERLFMGFKFICTVDKS